LDAEEQIDTEAMMADINTLPPALALSIQDTLPLCMNRHYIFIYLLKIKRFNYRFVGRAYCPFSDLYYY